MTDEAVNLAFARTELAEKLAPPVTATGAIGWLRRNLLNSWFNILLTLVSLYLIWLIVPPLVRFLIIDAVWDGAGRDDCLPEKVGREVGACWPFIQAKFSQLVYGFYPPDQYWRVNLTFALGAALLIPLLIPPVPYKTLNAVLFFAVFPIVAFFLLLGGVFGLEHVETRAWGGLLVTMIVAVTGIVASLPLGILLALGRRSQLPVVRSLSVIFIEFWRGVPLITVLFFATYMLPLFLPANWTIDALLRALVGVALFSAAYMAEVVRGGLQAIPKGQYEGAMALGLGYWKMMGLIVLPQALKLVIPGIVNTFIGLFKDTSLVAIVGIFDLVKTIEASRIDPAWAAPTIGITGYA
ncbi:MAG: amino acid ABC transporter permease, partial [Xanthobacteraceae bacterium]